MEKLVDRFLKYVSFETSSDPETGTTPSTPSQLKLGEYIVNELKEIGLQDAKMDEKGYVTATLPSNIDKKVKTIGFIAHMDTSPDMSGKDVKPRIIKNYDGKDIQLSDSVTMTVKDFPELSAHTGKDLIVTDGTTLLGADDKAGLAEIVTAFEYLLAHPEIKHGELKLGFTPDEEIGEGADHFDVEGFGADFAYTMDGSDLGEIEYENFNAASAKVTIYGRNVHPGTAKDKMVNSVLIAMEFQKLLPSEQVPEKTEGYEGFYLLNDLKGSVEETKMNYIIRDFDKAEFENKKANFQKVAKQIEQNFPQAKIVCEVKDQYYNMREKVEPNMFLVEAAKEAMEMAGVKPHVMPIRGGTDGARLSYMGLVTPNLFAGGVNFHGKYEYLPIQSMEKATEVIINLAKLYGENKY